MFVQVIQVQQEECDDAIDVLDVAVEMVYGAMQNAGAAPDARGNKVITVEDLNAEEDRGVALCVLDAAVGTRILRGISAAVGYPWRSLSLEIHAGEVLYAELSDAQSAVDVTGEAREVLEEWALESPVQTDKLKLELDKEGHLALAFALLGLPEQGGLFMEDLRFSIHERERWLLASEQQERPAHLPARWRRFEHTDGRRWAVRMEPDGFELEIGAGDDLLRRRRASPDPAAQVRELIEEQLHDGFVEVDDDPTSESS